MIRIELEFFTIQEAQEALAKLTMDAGKLDKALDKAIDAALVLPTPALAEKAQKDAPPSAQVAQALGKKPPKEKKPKAEKKAAPVETANEAAPAKPEAPVPAPEAKADGKGALYNETKQALMDHAVKHGKDAALALLKKYGAAKISEVPEDKRSALIVDCEA